MSDFPKNKSCERCQHQYDLGRKWERERVARWMKTALIEPWIVEAVLGGEHLK